MRAINLLPPRYQPARASGQRTGIAYAAIGVLAVLLVMIVAYVLTNNSINDAKDKTAQAQQEQQVAQAKIGQLQSYGDFATLKTSREAAVKGVADARFDYERLMREIALLLPHNTYLTQLSSTGAAASADQTATTGTTTATGPTISVNGCAPSHRGVADAIVRMRKLHNVQDVELKTSQKSSAGGAAAGGAAICKVQWTASLTFNPESAPTTPQPVPARLGGGQ
jgi:Tfp pilus assembly protein PilN